MKYKKMPLELKVYIAYLHQDKGTRICELERRFSEYPKTTIYRAAKQKIGRAVEDKRHKNKGRPRKLILGDNDIIDQSVELLQTNKGIFTSKDVLQKFNVRESAISRRTVRRYLQEKKYGYFQCRKKGLLSPEDLTARLKFANQCKKLPTNFWTEGISFYLDGTSWVHKRNPASHAKTFRTRTWRKKCQGLKPACCTKGKKEGSGGRVAKFMTAVAHSKGIVKCYQYEGRINGEKFVKFIEEQFPDMFLKGNNKKGKLFLQDGDPSQNCKISREAMGKVGCRLFKIPARSPDLNPIENVFHLIGKRLREDAVSRNLTKETFRQFSKRIIHTVLTFPTNVIDKTIESMPRRIDSFIKCQGQRTKY